MSNGTGFRNGQLDRQNGKPPAIPHGTPAAVRDNYLAGYGK